MKNKKYLALQVGIFIGYIMTIVVNALANILPINGLNTGELSDNIPNLFVPAGLTFSVWGVIYVLLALFTGYSISDWFSKNQKTLLHVEEIGLAFIISSLANTVWIFLWHYQLINLSLIAMLCILGSLIYAHVKISRFSEEQKNLKWKWFVSYPFSVYLGWITVATVANVTAVLVVNNWNGFGISESIWTIIMISVAALVTIIMILRERDLAYALVVIWAFAGIIIKRLDPANPPQIGIVVTAGISIGLIVVSYLFTLSKKSNK